MFNRSKSKKVEDNKIKETNLDMIVLQNKEIDASDIDGEKVMMNLEKGEYFMFNPVASAIWDIIEQPIKVSGIIETLLKEYDVEPNVCEESVLGFLNELKDRNLINITS